MMKNDKAPGRTVTVRFWTGEIPAYSYYVAKPTKRLFERASSLYVRRCPELPPLPPVGSTAELGSLARTLAAAFL
ncbi:MAG: hypothetical protein HOV87_01950 [Catenulispora sp.]|nr:hypothetical protein [Catenulispora sp.]